MAPLLQLGPLGQLTGTHTYTLLTLGFTTVDDTAQQRAIASLSAAAGKIVTIFPWLAGQVVTVGLGNDKTGTFQVVAYTPHEGPTKFLHVKDCRSLKEVLPYENILKAGAPLSTVDGRILSPGFGFPHMYPNDTAMPVMIMQANLLQGGIFLTICAQHNVMDGNANARFIKHFAKICSGQELSASEIEMGNIDRETLVPKASDPASLDPLQYFRMPSLLSQPAPTWPPSYGSAPWRCFHISASTIAALSEHKVVASLKSSSLAAAPYVSTDDLLTALIWKHLVRARRVRTHNAKTTLIRGINGRARFSPPLSQDYMGHVITCSYTRINLADLLSLPLSDIASTLRDTLLKDVTPHHLESFVHLLRTTEDRTTINFGASMDPKTDIMITSFVAQGIYEANFGADSGLGSKEKDSLGLPDVVRRPNLPDGQGLVYMLPKARDGSVDFVASLDDEELKGLKEGEGFEEWAKMVHLIG